MKKLISFVFAALISIQPAFAGKLLSIPLTEIKTIEKLNINQDRLVVLKGPIRDVTALQERLAALDQSKGQIVMIIDSQGGSVVDGFKLIQTMESLDNKLVCIVETKAFSMAAFIAAYCPTLYVYKFAMIMFHQASYTVSGNQTQIKTQVATTEKYLDQLFKDIASKLGLSLVEFKNKIRDEYWLTADEAVSNGFANAKLLKLKYNYEEPKFNVFEKFLNSLKLPFEILINRIR